MKPEKNMLCTMSKPHHTKGLQMMKKPTCNPVYIDTCHVRGKDEHLVLQWWSSWTFSQATQVRPVNQRQFSIYSAQPLLTKGKKPSGQTSWSKLTQFNNLVMVICISTGGLKVFMTVPSLVTNVYQLQPVVFIVQ